MKQVRPECKGVTQLALAGAVLFSLAAPLHGEEFLLFPSVTGVARSAGNNIDKKSELEPAVDFFYSRTSETLQILSEFLLTRDENELERIQFGLTSAHGYTVWLGRFHTPISYWNTAYHHGAYLQPSIFRPGIAEYEDHQGILPMHTTGVLVNGSYALQGQRVNYELSAGLGPIFKNELEPFNPISPQGHGKLTAAAKVGLQSDEARGTESEGNELGFILGYTDIPIRDGSGNHIRQQVASVFANQGYQAWRVIAELTFMRSHTDASADTASKVFGNGYAHVEYKLNEKWTMYGRQEASSHADNAFLERFPEFIKARSLLGMRWTPRDNHALKLEVSQSTQQDGDHFHAIGVQWSMVFP